MRRDQHDGRPGVVQLPRQVEAARVAEHDVDEDDVGPELVRPFERLAGRRRYADNLEPLALEQTTGSVQKGAVVVDDEAAERHSISIARGSPPRIAASRNLEGSVSGASRLRLAAMTAAQRSAMVFGTKPTLALEVTTMEPVLMPEIEIDLDRPADEDLLVHAWRAEQLREVGLPAKLAERFADVVDWHELAALVQRGCPAELALEIVR
jgi:hypothetical protein